MLAPRILAATGIVLMCLAGSARAARPSVPTLAPEQLQPGQRAVVRTVFQGARIDTFEAEIVGVLEGGATEGVTILARATSERVVRSGVAQGMSGSPVYVNGRLIGALSSGWSFSKEPLFGITPIGEMLAVLDHPAASAADGTAGPGGLDMTGRVRDITCGALRWAGADDAPRVEPARGTYDGLVPLALPLCGALRPAAAAVLMPWFEAAGLRLAPGGRAVPVTGAETLEPGSAVAVDVLRGDLQLSAIGTVTYRDGDRVLIFGHPFFQAGDVRLPLSTATITTIVASAQNSFKIGQRGVEVGLATQDRRAAVAGTLGVHGELMPFSLEIVTPGQPTQRFRFETVGDKVLAPVMLATASLNGLLESGGTGPQQTLRWSLDLFRQGAPPLRLADVVSGDSPMQELAAAVAAPVRFLLNNPYERCRLDSLRVRIDVAPRRTQWSLRSARLLDNAVPPGSDARVRCEIESWRGERRAVDLTLRVPEEVPDGSYVVEVGGGGEVTRYEAQRLPGRFRASSLDDAWRRLADQRPAGSLCAAAYALAPEVTRRGTDYPELPLSALALLAGPTTAGEESRPGTIARLDERSIALDGPVRGEFQLPLRVERSAR